MNYEQLCAEVCKLAKETGAYIREEAKRFASKSVEVKGHNNFVSHVDKNSEQRLVTALSALLPEAGFIAEEGTSDKKGERYNWIIDPLDGTTNFIHGFPCYAISIALHEKINQIILGVIYEINQDECFYAWKDSAAFMNGKKISVSKTATLKDSLLGTGFPYYDYGKMDEYLQLFRHLMKHSHGLRRPGSAATDLAYLACGRFDGFYEYSLSPWDVAAGAFLVERAGGKVTDFSGDNNWLFGKEIVAANSAVFEELKMVVGKFMNKK